MLDTLDAISNIVGFSNENYSGNHQLHDLVNKKKVKTLGDFASCDVESIISMHPDVVIISGDNKHNPKVDQIEKAGIPVIENLEWMEKSALGRAEWVKLFGVITGKTELATTIYKGVAENYGEVLNTARSLGKSKRYLIYGIPYQSSWMVPGKSSFMAGLLMQAGFSYPWQENASTGSIPIDIETVFNDENRSSVWLAPSVSSTVELNQIDTRLKDLSAWQNGAVYKTDNKRGVHDLSLYWEQSVLRCDLLLQDLIQIAHDTVIFDKGLYFYRKLAD